MSKFGNEFTPISVELLSKIAFHDNDLSNFYISFLKQRIEIEVELFNDDKQSFDSSIFLFIGVTNISVGDIDFSDMNENEAATICEFSISPVVENAASEVNIVLSLGYNASIIRLRFNFESVFIREL